MRESQLVKRMNAIQEALEEKELINSAEKLAVLYGKGKTETHSCHSSRQYQFEEDGLKIDLNDGWSMYGGGAIRIYSKGEEVLHGDRYSKNKEENRYNPEVDGFCILTYHPGRWEDELNRILEEKRNPKKPKKPAKPKNPKIDKETLDRLNTQFSDLK